MDSKTGIVPNSVPRGSTLPLIRHSPTSASWPSTFAGRSSIPTRRTFRQSTIGNS